MLNQGLGSWIHKRRVKSRGHIAIVSGTQSLTYEQLAERIDRLANALGDAGIKRGDRVAYLGNNHPAFLETLFACGSIGAIFVPINSRLAAREVAFALEDSGTSLLVNARQLDELAVAATEKSPVSARWVVEEDASSVGTYEAAIRQASVERHEHSVSMEDTAIILYTSGTTGNPKGAILTHGNLTWNSMNVLIDYDVTSTQVALMIAPMFHVASLGMGALPTLLKGGTLVLQDRFEPSAVLSAIEQYGVTSLSGVPTTYQMLAEHPNWETTNISSIRMLTCGGSSVPGRVLDAYEKRGLSFSGGYGMTETSPGATSLQPEYSREKAGSAGLPHFFTGVRIVDAGGDDVPANDVGEILIQGPNVIPGYWNRPDATTESFLDGDWFKSGDMGYVDEQGFLYIADRLKDMIISGGENIYPAQVEQAIMELPAVDSVAVIGVPDEKWGEAVHAVIVAAPGQQISRDDVAAHLEGKLARYKIPRTIEVVDEMPRTASGKIRKTDLREAHRKNALA
ncbi:long-chain fatty acid--CoA ligase [Paeniglutamicibacter psychrophenolicus]|uniref:Fatty-acyl-CoA synthase n=1 Tax=Paeniglutamicibacter psychrophenolicus TaxID=257454 RepID=A0ABS4W9H8_9MICC|nr:o-succinylbenzoate--CoA ligase [Paeniglutamicibacter psychrophenolicus]MBP2372856.1 fatty-acyl-CoA synthase [Paeniglutamicibacter psychrophenolicus]